MRAFKIELLILDFDDIGADEIESVLEQTRYPNRSIKPDVMLIQSADIGEWHDDHPLNTVPISNRAYIPIAWENES